MTDTTLLPQIDTDNEPELYGVVLGHTWQLADRAYDRNERMGTDRCCRGLETHRENLRLAVRGIVTY